MKDMKGLSNFIKEIRNCQTQEAETKRINKELANIREKFGGSKAAKLDGYSKKKYISKLLFIFLLGNDIEFGHLEAINLLSSSKFQEKQIGYLFCSVLLSENHDLIQMVSTAIAADLGEKKELVVCLALNCIANLGGKVIADSARDKVMMLLTAKDMPDFVKKKCALALLRLYRHASFDITVDRANKIIEVLSHTDLGVVTAVASLLIALAQSANERFKGCVSVAVNRLHRITMASSTSGATEGVLPHDSEYMYHSIPAPWLSVKLMRLLQCYAEPAAGPTLDRLKEALNVMLLRAQPPDVTKGKPKAQYTNANQAVFFEAVQLIAHYDSNEKMQLDATKQLGQFFAEPKPNVRFLALEGLSIMAQTRFAQGAVRDHLEGVIQALHDSKDNTVQRRAVDVMYGVCEAANVEKIVKDLLRFMKKADYSVREEVVLKIAILAEKHAADYKWYVNVILTLIAMSGDHVAEEVWHRVLQIIINRTDVQFHSARLCFQAMCNPACHEAMIKVGAYVLGEFGHLIANDPASTPEKQLQLLQTHYPMVSVETRSLVLSTYAKFTNLFPEIKPAVQAIFKQDNVVRSFHTEIQQRANEYFNLSIISNAEVIAKVLDEMPVYDESKSSLLSKLDKGKDMTDKLGKAPSNLDGSAPSADGKIGPPPAEGAPIKNETFLCNFKGADSGKLFENAAIQIGGKFEFKGQHARLTLFYGNQSDVAFTDMTAKIYMTRDADGLKCTAQGAEPTLGPKAQVPQMFNFECLGAYGTLPTIDINANFNGAAVLFRLTVPVGINKYLTQLPAALTQAAFGQKWGALNGPGLEASETIDYEVDFTRESLVAALTAYKLPESPGIDPNAANVVCCAVLPTSAAQIGILIRVEPNIANSTVKYTLRSSNASVNKPLLKLLQNIF